MFRTKTNKRKKATICILALVLVLAMTACGSGNTATQTTGDAQTTTGDSQNEQTTVNEVTEQQLPEVELKWYLLSNSQPDDALVYGEANKYIKEKINATVDFIPLNMGEYEDKITVKMQSGEKMDLVYTCSWLNIYNDNVAKGALLPIDDLLAQYAPNLKASIPQKFWELCKVKRVGDDTAKLYAVPNYQIEVTLNGLEFNKKYVDKYNLTDAINNIKTLDDLTPIFKMVHDNEKDVICVLNSSFGWYDLSGEKVLDSQWICGPLSVDIRTFKVIDKYEDPEFLKTYAIARDWYLKGYIHKDAMILKDTDAIKKQGKVFCDLIGSAKPGVEIEEKTKYGYDVIVKPALYPTTSAGQVTATMNGISKSSENPERTMMLLELVNTDKYLYNLLNFGIENTHYTKVDDNTIEVKADSKFNPGMAWALGNQFNAYVMKGQPADVWEQTMALNEKAEINPLGGFSFNIEPVKTEYAQIEAVEQTYEQALWTGAMDPEKTVPIIVEKIKKNDNLKKVMDECQKQLDDWRAQNAE